MVQVFLDFWNFFYLHGPLVERGISAVECQTRNRESPDSNPLCALVAFKSLGIFILFYPRRPSSLRCINEYLADGNMSE